MKRYMLFAVIMLISCVTITVQASSANTQVTNSDLNAAQKELNELKEQLDKAEGLVDDLQNSEENIKEKLSELNQSMIRISEKITELENLLIAKNEEIQETRIELAGAEENAKNQYEAMKLRIQYMYENGQFSYAEAFFKAESISDFLNSAEYISQIQRYDRQKLEDFNNTIVEIEELEAQLEEEHAQLETMKNSVEHEKKNVAKVMAQRENELSEIKSNLSEAQNEAEMLEAEIQAQEEVISEIKRIMAENANKGEAYNGTFLWPVPASKRVTSDFGLRESPTAGASSNHKGIDIGAASGSDIVAVAPGKVIISRYSSSAGYYITIDHGGGLYSVYMHCSSLLASVGDVVTSGQVIAKVGSTGISTGPHLHFGVSLNGSYVSPWGYLARP